MNYYKILLFCYLILILFGVKSENFENNLQNEYLNNNVYSLFNFLNYSTDNQCVLDIIEILDELTNIDLQFVNISDNLEETFEIIKGNELWPLKMVDSSSKLQSGFALGNVVNMGSFDECLAIKGKTKDGRQIKGKYCLYGLFLSFVPQFKELFQIPVGFIEKLKGYKGAPLIEAICVPDSCSSNDLNNLFNTTELNTTIVQPAFMERFCQTTIGPPEFSYLEWITVILVVGDLILIIICTCLDLLLRKLKKKPFNNILISFSLYTNIKKLTEVRRNPDQLPCINGIRFLSMTWVVIGHKYLISIILPHVNYIDVPEWINATSSSLVISGLYSVDTFFFISGLLVIYVVLLAKEKEFNFNLIHYYLHRLFRLSPAFVMLLLMYMTFLPYLSSGPLWPFMYECINYGCVKNWWNSLIFIQNFQDYFDICITHSWYLGIDTQLYFLAPILFIPIQKWPKLTLMVIVVMIVISCISGAVISWNMQIAAGVLSIIKSFQELYASTLVRMNAWFIGAILGYFLFIKRGTKIYIQKKIVIILWIITLVVMCWLIYMYAYFNQHKPNQTFSSFFMGFSKAIWCTCLCWIVFACVHGYGGYINTFLSNKVFIVLGRLTYSMYLLHFPLLMMNAGQIRQNTVFSNRNTLYEFAGDFIYILIISIFWTLAFESPLIIIGKELMSKELRTKLKQIQQENHNNLSEETNHNHNTRL